MVKKLVIVECYTTWCGPCKRIEKDVCRLPVEYPEIRLDRVDLDEHDGVDELLNITSIPTFVFMVNNEEVDRVVGTDLSEVRSRIEHHLGMMHQVDLEEW